MSATCSNCKYWTLWHTLQTRDGDHAAEISMGHCVIIKRVDANLSIEHPQGLTGEDFYCPAYKERGANE